MIEIIYPERRMVPEETIIGWAKDSLVDRVLGKRDYDETDAEFEANEQESIDRVQQSADYRLMTLQDAITILEDEGSIVLTASARSFIGYGSDGFDINALPLSAEVICDEE